MTELVDRPVTGDGEGGADAFRVLGLPYSPDLTDADVHRAYRARLRAVHPDAGGDAGAAAAVTAAYVSVRSGVRRGELLAAAMTDRGDPPVAERAERRVGWGADAPMPDAARRAELRERVAASRRAQGLPPHITDPATRIADRGPDGRDGAGRPGAGAGAASGGRRVAAGARSASSWSVVVAVGGPSPVHAGVRAG